MDRQEIFGTFVEVFGRNERMRGLMKKYIMAILIWIIIIPIAILNGGFREYVLVNLGVLARPFSGIILSICIFVVAFFLVPKIKNCDKKRLLYNRWYLVCIN